MSQEFLVRDTLIDDGSIPLHVELVVESVRTAGYLLLEFFLWGRVRNLTDTPLSHSHSNIREASLVDRSSLLLRPAITKPGCTIGNKLHIVPHVRVAHDVLLLQYLHLCKLLDRSSDLCRAYHILASCNLTGSNRSWNHTLDEERLCHANVVNEIIVAHVLYLKLSLSVGHSCELTLEE